MALGTERDGMVNGLRVPVILLVVSLFVFMAFETGQAIHDRSALSEVRRSQEPTVQEAIKIRQQLETLAGKTAQLAGEGDEGAKAVIDEMKRQGVTLAPPKQ
jgi:regulatory protein YycI of two-component signal transduction system YycFG